jgi:hypothetical protein
LNLVDVPTKVRKTPQHLAQACIYTRTHGFLRSSKIRRLSGR